MNKKQIWGGFSHTHTLSEQGLHGPGLGIRVKRVEHEVHPVGIEGTSTSQLLRALGDQGPGPAPFGPYYGVTSKALQIVM